MDPLLDAIFQVLVVIRMHLLNLKTTEMQKQHFTKCINAGLDQAT